MADDRLYIKVTNDMPDHPKVELLSDAAFRLLVTLWCWSDRHNLDGQIPQAAWQRRGTPKSRRELIDGNLAHLGDGFVQMHDYLEHQRSAEQKQAAKARARTAGAAGGKAKAKQAASKSLSEPLGNPSSGNVAEVELEVEKEKEPRAKVTPIRSTATVVGSALLDEHYQSTPTPRRVMQKMGEIIDELVAEGFDADVIREALARLREKPNGGPGLLPSIVGDVMRDRTPQPRTSSARMFG